MEDRLRMLAEDEVIVVDDPTLLDMIKEGHRGYLSNAEIIHNLNIRPCWWIINQGTDNEGLKLFGLSYERVAQEIRDWGIEPRPCDKYCRW